MDTRPRHRVVLPVPEDSIPLPVGETGEAELRAWAVSVADAQLAALGGHQEVERFAAMLVEATNDSARRGAGMAMLFVPYPLGGEAGRIEIRDYAASPAMPRVPDLDDVVDWLASPGDGAAQPEVLYGELPLGPAARVKFGIATAPAEAKAGVCIPMNVVYVVRPREHDSLIVMNVTWFSGIFAEELDVLADQLVQQMQIQADSGSAGAAPEVPAPR